MRYLRQLGVAATKGIGMARLLWKPHGLRIEFAWLVVAAALFIACLIGGFAWFDEGLYEKCQVDASARGCTPGPDVSVFAFVFVAAALVERLLELVGPWFGATKVAPPDAHGSTQKLMTKAGLYKAFADSAASSDEKRKAESQIHSNRTALWLVGAGLGILVCAWTNAVLLRPVGAEVDGRWDLLATGLVVGGGTKVVHDLISTLQKQGTSGSAAGNGG